MRFHPSYAGFEGASSDWVDANQGQWFVLPSGDVWKIGSWRDFLPGYDSAAGVLLWLFNADGVWVPQHPELGRNFVDRRRDSSFDTYADALKQKGRPVSESEAKGIAAANAKKAAARAASKGKKKAAPPPEAEPEVVEAKRDARGAEGTGTEAGRMGARSRGGGEGVYTPPPPSGGGFVPSAPQTAAEKKRKKRRKPRRKPFYRQTWFLATVGGVGLLLVTALVVGKRRSLPALPAPTVKP
jgi:hypothetical protein